MVTGAAMPTLDDVVRIDLATLAFDQRGGGSMWRIERVRDASLHPPHRERARGNTVPVAARARLAAIARDRACARRSRDRGHGRVVCEDNRECSAWAVQAAVVAPRA